MNTHTEELILYTTTPNFMSIITMGYFSMIHILTKYMRYRKPYSLKYAMLIYNNTQIILNIYIPYTSNIRYFVYVHYLSKYFDYFDTLFIILRGKEKQQLSFLHVYHHSTIGIIWGGLLYCGHGNGTVSFGCFINSVIHLFMYSHYLYTSLGYNNPFKKYITRAQLIQFFLCLIHSLVVLAIDNSVPKKYAIIELVYQTSMIILFSKFYYKSYTPKIDNDT